MASYFGMLHFIASGSQVLATLIQLSGMFLYRSLDKLAAALTLELSTLDVAITFKSESAGLPACPEKNKNDNKIIAEEIL